jgi:hypothetical protein
LNAEDKAAKAEALCVVPPWFDPLDLSCSSHHMHLIRPEVDSLDEFITHTYMINHHYCVQGLLWYKHALKKLQEKHVNKQKSNKQKICQNKTSKCKFCAKTNKNDRQQMLVNPQKVHRQCFVPSKFPSNSIQREPNDLELWKLWKKKKQKSQIT